MFVLRDNAEEKIGIQTEDDGSWLGLMARKNFWLFFLSFFFSTSFICMEFFIENIFVVGLSFS